MYSATAEHGDVSENITEGFKRSKPDKCHRKLEAIINNAREGKKWFLGEGKALHKFIKYYSCIHGVSTLIKFYRNFGLLIIYSRFGGGINGFCFV